MREIPSTQGYVIKVDDDDYERLSKYRWYAHNTGGHASLSKRPARRQKRSEGRRVVFLVHHILRAPPGMVVDHINGDPWDNRRSNLRVCTNAENLRNRRKHGASCTNPFKGAFLFHGRWRATVCLDRITYALGHYDTAEEAARAYDAAALFLHGKFARLNFPNEGTEPRHPDAIREAWRQRKLRAKLAKAA